MQHLIKKEVKHTNVIFTAAFALSKGAEDEMCWIILGTDYWFKKGSIFVHFGGILVNFVFLFFLMSLSPM